MIGAGAFPIIGSTSFRHATSPVRRDDLPRMTTLDGKPALVYARNPGAADLSFVIEGSENLEQSTGLSMETVSVAERGEPKIVTLVEQDSSGNETRRFLRLRVIRD